jgi:hypothetical protein
VAGDPLALHSQISQGYHDSDELELQAHLCLDHTRHHAAFDVKGTQRVLQISQIALDFDDEQRPGLRMPGQHIHRPSVAVVIERVFDPGLPTERGQQLDDSFDQGSVPPVDLSLDLRAAY